MNSMSSLSDQLMKASNNGSPANGRVEQIYDGVCEDEISTPLIGAEQLGHADEAQDYDDDGIYDNSKPFTIHSLT